MSLQRAQTCLITPYRFLSKSIQANKLLQVNYTFFFVFDSFKCSLSSSLEFDLKRRNAVSTNEQLQQEAQFVLDVIENPDVAQALRQDKNQNLQYLKDNYNVRPCQKKKNSLATNFILIASKITIAYSGTNYRTLQLWSISILVWKLQRSSRLPVSFPGPFDRQRSDHISTLG